MDRKRICLVLTAAACIMLAAVLAGGALCIWLEGTAKQAEDPMKSVYTAEKVSAWLTAALPIAITLVILIAAGIILGAKDSKAGRTAGQAGVMKAGTETKHRRIIRIILIAAAAVLIIAGVLNGSAKDVLIKAIYICRECIGIG